jgi:hypothetical protein
LASTATAPCAAASGDGAVQSFKAGEADFKETGVLGRSRTSNLRVRSAAL